MMTITEALVTEHAVFRAVFDQIERVLPHLQTLAEVRMLASLVEAVLLRHGATEEDLVLVALDHVLERKKRCDRFYSQHQEIDVRLRQAHEATRLVEARSLLQGAVLSSRRHFEHEERWVFPLVERVMKRDQLTKLGRMWMQQRTRPTSLAARRTVRRE